MSTLPIIKTDSSSTSLSSAMVHWESRAQMYISLLPLPFSFPLLSFRSASLSLLCGFLGGGQFEAIERLRLCADSQVPAELSRCGVHLLLLLSVPWYELDIIFLPPPQLTIQRPICHSSLHLLHHLIAFNSPGQPPSPPTLEGWAIAVIVIVIVLAVGTVVLFATVPKLRKMVRPYAQREYFTPQNTRSSMDDDDRSSVKFQKF